MQHLPLFLSAHRVTDLCGIQSPWGVGQGACVTRRLWLLIKGRICSDPGAASFICLIIVVGGGDEGHGSSGEEWFSDSIQEFGF